MPATSRCIDEFERRPPVDDRRGASQTEPIAAGEPDIMARTTSPRATAGSPCATPLPPEASPGRRWRFRRNLVIYLAHRRNGLSQRFLADVFDLPRSRIADIIKEFAVYDTRDDRPGPLPNGA